MKWHNCKKIILNILHNLINQNLIFDTIQIGGAFRFGKHIFCGVYKW